MTTLTLNLDDAAAQKARQIARRQHTSLEEMLCGFVVRLSQTDPDDAALPQRESAAQRLLASFQELSRPLGGKGYTSRDELHER